ncbi:uncharacterized protein LOC113378502 [Ctenocephalides felis]|uniref:uncharacterized protein LOC113378502 n=1 Tax=Ctenocephalides felis TaxID=7515 RepID=UPI000E6E1B77|nr:uncharacterized protein LOC113378502 [Ctenocephalides felis]
MSNRYKEQFPSIKLQLCPLLESLKVTQSSQFVSNLVSKFLLPIITKFREGDQKFPDRCAVSARNYRLMLKSLHVDYINTNLAFLHKMEVQKLNRSYASMFVNVTIKKPLENLVGEGQLYKRMSNRYKEHFPLVKLQLCPILESAKVTNNNSSFVTNFVAKFAQPIVAKFQKEGGNFPKRCPIPADNYHVNYHLDEDLFPAFLLPEGTWKLAGNLSVAKNLVVGLNCVFDIVTYSSEKQKNKMG